MRTPSMGAAAQGVTAPSRPRTTSTTLAATRIEPLNRIEPGSLTTGKMSAAQPTTSRMLAMLEPTTVPMAMPDAPLRCASRPTMSSGALVP